MHVMCNGIRYDDYPYVDTNNDEDEIYVVLQNNELQLSAFIAINTCAYIPITIAYYCSLIDKTIKYIDNDTYIPVRKFINKTLHYMVNFSTNPTAYQYFPEYINHNVEKVIMYILIDDVCERIDNNDIKQYIFNNQTLLMIETYNKDIEKESKSINKYSFNRTVEIMHFQYCIM